MKNIGLIDVDGGVPHTKEEVSSQWYVIEIELFHTHVFVCEGSVEEMLSTGASAFTKLNFDDDCVKDIGESLAALIPTLNNKNAGECYDVKTSNHGTVQIIRLNECCPQDCHDIAVLSHECLHASLNILKSCGVKETGGHECLCYLQEMIFENLLAEIHKVKNPLPRYYAKKEKQNEK